MSFDSIRAPSFREPVCWFQIIEDMRKLSIGLRQSDDIKDQIIQMFNHLFHISHVYNLDMNKAWERWHKKARTKKYDHSET